MKIRNQYKLYEYPTTQRDGSEIPVRNKSLDKIPTKPARGNGSVDHETFDLLGDIGM